METPSSTRRMTRSQGLAALNSSTNKKSKSMTRKIEESEMGVSKLTQRTVKEDRSALIDITNDSPIIGVATEKLGTPSSAMSKNRITNSRANHCTTPGSGEALLRGQVKTLLQKVEEEAELSKLLSDCGPAICLRRLLNSPMGLLAPTPANTPHVLNLSGSRSATNNHCSASVSPSPVADPFEFSQMVAEMLKRQIKGDVESDKCLITRSLLLDFGEKLEGSEVAEGDGKVAEKYCKREGEEEEEEEEEGVINQMCEGLRMINMDEEREVTKRGKHIRFLYDSDGEIEGEEVDCGGDDESHQFSSGVLHPKGKHLLFHEESEEEY